MLTSLFGRCIGLWTVVCVLLLFFFPLAHGNFQSTHGPVTALRSKRSLLLLFFSIMLAALQVLAISIPSLLLQIRCWRTRINSYFGHSRHVASFGILRC
jgi:hypothetical protein